MPFHPPPFLGQVSFRRPSNEGGGRRAVVSKVRAHQADQNAKHARSPEPCRPTHSLGQRCSSATAKPSGPALPGRHSDSPADAGHGQHPAGHRLGPHGGGFVNGSGNAFNGERLAQTANAIVVTANYRLDARTGRLAPCGGPLSASDLDERPGVSMPTVEAAAAKRKVFLDELGRSDPSNQPDFLADAVWQSPIRPCGNGAYLRISASRSTLHCAHQRLTGRTASGCSFVNRTSSVSWWTTSHSPSRSVYCTCSTPISTSSIWPR